MDRREQLGRAAHQEAPRQFKRDTGLTLGSWEETAPVVQECYRDTGSAIAQATLAKVLSLIERLLTELEP